MTAPGQARVAEIRIADGDHVGQGDLVVALRRARPARRRWPRGPREHAQARARLDNARRNHDAAGRAAREGHRLAQGGRGRAQGAARRGVGGARVGADAAAARRRPGRAGHAGRARFAGVVAERWHNPGDVVTRRERSRAARGRPRAPAGHGRGAGGGRSRASSSGTPRGSPSPAARRGDRGARCVSPPAAVDPATGTGAVRVGAPAGPRPSGTPVRGRDRGRGARERRHRARRRRRARGGQDGGLRGRRRQQGHRRDGRRSASTTAEEVADRVRASRAGEKVVVKGQDELPDGATVTVEAAESRSHARRRMSLAAASPRATRGPCCW